MPLAANYAPASAPCFERARPGAQRNRPSRGENCRALLAEGVKEYTPPSVDRDAAELSATAELPEGWHAVSHISGTGEGGLPDNGGITSHRGVLHPDEYVDQNLLQELVERELGFTYEQVRSVYREGRPSAESRELRAQIDARLLALSDAGGSMLHLARAFGWKIDEAGETGGENCRTLERALERARAAA